MTAIDRADPAWAQALPPPPAASRAERWRRAVRAEARDAWMAKATCPTCRAHLRPEDDAQVAEALDAEEREAFDRGRLGFLACDGCDALYPWESL